MYPGSASNNPINHKSAKTLSFRMNPQNNTASVVATSPSANIEETDTEYLIALAAPGLCNSDFAVEILDGVITISANHTKQKTAEVDRKEYDYSNWTRKFELPCNADALLAHGRYKNGELIIRIPKGNITDQKNTTIVYVY